MAPGSGSSRKKTKHGQGPYATIKTKNVDLPVFSQLNDMDVLCGRGNGINMREGNIQFRNHVDDLRTAYVAAQRQEKVEIARRVVEMVSSKGGRFVKYKNSPNEEVYVEIGLERAVEKACQALREGCGKKKQEVRKMKRDMVKSHVGKGTAERSSSSRTKDGNKTKVPKKKRNAGAKQSLIKKGRSKSSLWQGPHHQSGGSGGTPSHDTFEEDSFVENTETPGMDYSTDSDSMDGNTDDEYPGAARYYNHYHQPRSSGSAEDKDNPAPSQQPPTHRLMMAGSSPPSNTDQPEVSGWFCDYMNGENSDASLDWETLFRSLVQWKEVHGHCAIPPSAGIPHPDSSREEKEQARLADWASVQRQIFREIHKGRRGPTDEENIRFRRLQALGFVWDYEEWHWNRNYEELMKLQGEEESRMNAPSDGGVETESNGDRKSGATRADFSMRLRLALWVNDQRRLYRDGVLGKIHQMRADRVNKLEKVNFSWAEDLQLQGIAGAINAKPTGSKTAKEAASPIVTSETNSTEQAPAPTPSSAVALRTAVVSPETRAVTAVAPVTRDENGSKSPEPPAGGEIWRGTPDEPLEGGWPEGWIKKVYERKSGVSKGDTDRYWFSPKKQYKFRSMKQVQKYLGLLQKFGYTEEDEVTAWEMFRCNR